MNKIIQMLNEFLDTVIPHVDTLPQCWRITWFGREWLIGKEDNYRW